MLEDDWRLTRRRLAALLETHGQTNYARMAANGVVIAKAPSVNSDLRTLLARSSARAIETWQREAGAEVATILATVGRDRDDAVDGPPTASMCQLPRRETGQAKRAAHKKTSIDSLS
jgi:hypothetical protein